MNKTKALLLAAVLVVSGIMTQPAQAEHYGALRSYLQPGQLSLGLGGGLQHEKWTDGGPGILFRQKLIYGQASFGLGKEWVVTGRGGLVDMDSVTGSADFSSSPVPFLGGAIGGPLYRGKTLAIGPVVQGSYAILPFKSDGTEIENMLKLSGAMLAQLEIEGASLYLGPSINFGDATATGNTDLELSKRYGGVLGVRWLLPDNWPTETSNTYLDLELSTEEFKINRTDVTMELNFTF